MATMEDKLMQLKTYLEVDFKQSASGNPKNVRAVSLMELLVEDIKGVLIDNGRGQFVNFAAGTYPFTLDSPFLFINNGELREEAVRKFGWGDEIDIEEVIARCVEMNMLHQRFDRDFQLSPIETPWNIGYDDE